MFRSTTIYEVVIMSLPKPLLFKPQLYVY